MFAVGNVLTSSCFRMQFAFQNAVYIPGCGFIARHERYAARIGYVQSYGALNFVRFFLDHL